MTSSDQTTGEPATDLFALLPEHPANRLDGCAVLLGVKGSLAFDFQQPGHSVLVLKANAPLKITEQHGLSARLRPGWDGTLGYSLYALEIDADSAGEGRVRLAGEPVPVDTGPCREALVSRISRFPDRVDAFHHWQRERRALLAACLMDGGLPARVPLEAEVLATEVYPSFTLRRVRYQTQPDRGNTLLLALPNDVHGRIPLLVALHGHEATWGEADAGAFTQAGHADDFCGYFAARGWAVVQPATMDHTLQHGGWTLQGEWTWDAMAGLDYAAGQPVVDARRIAVCGLSTGAHLAMNLLALDDRIRAGVVGCILSTWHHYRTRMRIPPHCECGILRQLGDWLEQCDWAALAAPTPVQFQHGRRDAAFCPGADASFLIPGWNTAVMPEAEFAAVLAEVERAYCLAGTAEDIQVHYHNGGHGVDSAAAFAFLERYI